MAFSYTILEQGPSGAGGLWKIVGTWNADSVTSGTISSGLKEVVHASITDETGVRAGMSVSRSGGDVALAGVSSSDTGTFVIEGYQ